MNNPFLPFVIWFLTLAGREAKAELKRKELERKRKEKALEAAIKELDRGMREYQKLREENIKAVAKQKEKQAILDVENEIKRKKFNKQLAEMKADLSDTHEEVEKYYESK